MNVTLGVENGLTHSSDLFGFICLGLLVILTAFGNIIVCVAILRNRRLRTNSNLLVVNMAFGDIFYSISTLPLAMVLMSFPSKWPLGKAGNVFFDAIWLSFLVLSFLNIQVIALNRFITIARPYAYKRIVTTRRTVGVCFSIWAYVITLVFGLSWSLKATNGKVYKFLIPGKTYYSVLIIHAASTFVSVPLLYAAVFQIAKKHKREIVKQKERQTSRSFYRELKATWTTGLVIFLFLLVWLPFMTNQLVDFRDIYDGVWDKQNHVMCYITYCNGPVNIFVYSIWIREIRQAILGLFRSGRNNLSRHGQAKFSIIPVE